MKRYLHAFAMCQSMFCAIPSPSKIWDEEARPYMLLFLPVVGLEIGLGWAGLSWLANLLQLPPMVTALVLSLYPFAVTGCIHLDGFMDVTDAVKSCRGLERRREILKDSHVGAFAVIGAAMLLLAQFALFASVPQGSDCRVLCLIPVVSRCCSALAVARLKPMSTSQYAAQKANIRYTGIMCAMLLAALAAGFVFFGRYANTLLGCMIGYASAAHRGCRSLDGMNGDISGYALTVGELCAVAVYALL